MDVPDELARLVKGEPIFKADDVTAEEKQISAQVTPGKSPEEVLPTVRVENVQSETKTLQTLLRADLHNESDEAVLVETVQLMGVTGKLDLQLSSSQTQPRLLLYSGASVKTPQIDDMVLVYRTRKGEKFQAFYKVSTYQEDDGRLNITELKLQFPIQRVGAP